MEFTEKKALFLILKNDFFKLMQKSVKEEEFIILQGQINNFIDEIGIDFCISFIETTEIGKNFNWEIINKTPLFFHAFLFENILEKLNEYFEV